MLGIRCPRAPQSHGESGAHRAPGETIGLALSTGRRSALADSRCPTRPPMDAFLVSAAAVTLAEIGDKTQLLALMLAARFRRPWPIVAGILVATLVNHAIAASLGGWLRSVLPPDILKWGVAGSFFAVAGWTMIPDQLDQPEAVRRRSHLGVMGVTAVSFFAAEMGDKTQIATAVLGARFESIVAVVAGTTLGMLIADVPAVFAGHLFAGRLPLKVVRLAAAALFGALGFGILLAA
jgi:putative Ca2+/H+ antiporter (TMEM165/GDT1 family)